MSNLPGLFKVKASYKPTAEVESFIGEQGELFYSEGDTRLRISDGETPGGIIISSSSISSVSGFTIDEINQIVYLNSEWNLLPTDNDLQSLGSESNRWKDLYVSGGTIYFGDGVKIQVEESTGGISIPENTVLRNDNDNSFEPIARGNDVVNLQSQVTDLSSTITQLSSDNENISFTNIKTAEIPLNGTEFTLNFHSYSITDLLNYQILNSNNETVEVVSIVESDRLILESNIDLVNHTMRIVYQ